MTEEQIYLTTKPFHQLPSFCSFLLLLFLNNVMLSCSWIWPWTSAIPTSASHVLRSEIVGVQYTMSSLNYYYQLLTCILHPCFTWTFDVTSPHEGRQQKLYLKFLIISFCVWHLTLIKSVTIQVSYDTIKLNTHSSTTHAYITTAPHVLWGMIHSKRLKYSKLLQPT